MKLGAQMHVVKGFIVVCFLCVFHCSVHFFSYTALTLTEILLIKSIILPVFSLLLEQGYSAQIRLADLRYFKPNLSLCEHQSRHV